MNIKSGIKGLYNKLVPNKNRPFVNSITIRIMVDEDPCLEHLKQDYSDVDDYDERVKYLEQDEQRLKDYFAGKWSMLGISADAEVYVPSIVELEHNGFMIQHIVSGAVWGVESDSDDCIEEYKKDQLIELEKYLKVFNIRVPVDVEVKEVHE